MQCKILIIEHICIYWIYSLYSMYKNNLFEKFKNSEVNKNSFYVVLTNQIISGMLLYNCDLNVNEFYLNTVYIIFITIISDLYMIIFFHTVYFYIVHRLFHLPQLYKLHKLHHNNIITYPHTALYCHIIEHLLLNCMSVIIGVYIWKCHIYSVFIWVFIFTINTINSHNSISHKSIKKHDYHHLLHNVNYGSGFNFMDMIFNTYKK